LRSESTFGLPWFIAHNGFDAACNCGAPVEPIVKVQEHFKNNPDDKRSSRQIAAELGVGKMTVQREKFSWPRWAN
jgi:hypothetical protein